MERPQGTKMENWQLGGLVSPNGSADGLVVHEALQQSINRDALPLRFLPDLRFGLWRDVEAHANTSLPGLLFILRPSRSFVTATLHATPIDGLSKCSDLRR